MSNLSNLMISGSYKGLINLLDSTEPLLSQSVTLVDLQDGLGDNIGIQINKNNNARFYRTIIKSISNIG